VTDFEMKRIGMIMQPLAGEPSEVEGVLNPAAIRGKDGELYLFPRLVAKGNYSRIGIARVLFDANGDPRDVERMGFALEPEAEYELRGNGGGGCEDPRISYVEALGHYVMTYTALSSRGPRIAIAVSDDLFHWKRLGLASFSPYHGIHFEDVDNKDASCFSALVPDPLGKLRFGIIHRPLFPGTRPEETVHQADSQPQGTAQECIWISYCRLGDHDGTPQLGQFVEHHRLVSPKADWERLKIGGGAPPIPCRHGWLMIYHGVGDVAHPSRSGRTLRYSAGALVLAKDHPNQVIYRSPEPVLVPDTPLELEGAVDAVVFPTGIDRRDDIGQPDRFDVYYGMADDRIGVARLDVPEILPATS
jgi:predicted GH43/DUF377 family glycosyl hydrolase